MRQKMSEKVFVDKIAKNNNLEPDAVANMLDIILSEIQNVTKEGVEVAFRKFGSFYLKKHKGHPTQFEKDGKGVDDYVVFKFTASAVLNRRMRDSYHDGYAIPVQTVTPSKITSSK